LGEPFISDVERVLASMLEFPEIGSLVPDTPRGGCRRTSSPIRA
jgi:hypothetical protein